MKLMIGRGTAGNLLFKRQFRKLKEKAEKQEIIIVEINKEIHVINIKSIINNELTNNGIRNLILNNKMIIKNIIKTMVILKLIYRSLN